MAIPRPPETRQDQTLQDIRDSLREANRLLNQRTVTPAIIRHARQLLTNVSRMLNQLQTQQSVPKKTIREKAPVRRVYEYDVVIGTRRFTVSLRRPLTRGREADELAEMARHNRFFEPVPEPRTEAERVRRVTTPGTPAPAIEGATMTSGPRASEFNRGTLSARADELQSAIVRAWERGARMDVTAIARR